MNTDGIELDSVTAEYLAEFNDDVADAVEKAEAHEEMTESVDSLAEQLEVDSLDGVADKISAMKESLDSYKQRVEEIDGARAEELATFIKEHVDEDSKLVDGLDGLVEERNIDRLEERKSIVEEFVDADETEDTVANAGNDSTPTQTGPKRASPWD